jgi:YbbR domain-containing protein
MNRLLNNFWLKVLALGLACFLYLYVYLVADYPTTQTLYLPLQPEGLPETLLVVNQLPEKIQLQVRGPYRLLRGLQGDDLAASIDCTELTGSGEVMLRVKIPELDKRVDIIEQDRDYIEVKYDKRTTGTIPLRIYPRGEIDPNFRIASEDVSRKSVTVISPESVFETINRAQIEPNLSGRNHSYRDLYPVRLYDDEERLVLGPGLSVEPQEVEYSVEIVPVGSINVLKVIPASVGQPADEYLLDQLIPDPLYIPVPAELASDDDFFVRTEPIELTDARSSFTAQDVVILYPFEVPESARLPEACTVQVEIIALEEVGGISVVPELVGRIDEYDYVVAPPQVSIISEELARLESAARSSISAELYVDGLEPGEHKLTPQVFLPLSLDRVKIKPLTLVVTIIQSGEQG